MRRAQRERGVVLFMTLMVLVIMSIAGLALLRGVDSTTLVANNVGFKQGALIAADKAVQDAANLIVGGTLGGGISDLPAAGFYATPYVPPTIAARNAAIDWTGKVTPADGTDDVDWGAASASSPIRASAWSAMDSSGNKYSYIIHRLCDTTGPTSVPNSCATSTSTTAAVGSTRTGAAYGTAPLTVTTQVYYRITVKVLGPRNTTSYAQAFLLI